MWAFFVTTQYHATASRQLVLKASQLENDGNTMGKIPQDGAPKIATSKLSYKWLNYGLW